MMAKKRITSSCANITAFRMTSEERSWEKNCHLAQDLPVLFASYYKKKEPEKVNRWDAP